MAARYQGVRTVGYDGKRVTSAVTVRVPGDEEMLTRTRPHPSVILPIEGTPPIFSEGAQPDVLFRLGSCRVPVVASAALGGPDAGPARRPVDGTGVSRISTKVSISTGVVP